MMFLCTQLKMKKDNLPEIILRCDAVLMGLWIILNYIMFSLSVSKLTDYERLQKAYNL